MIHTNRRLLLNEKAPSPFVQPDKPNATAADPPALLQSNPSSMAFTAFVILVALFFSTATISFTTPYPDQDCGFG